MRLYSWNVNGIRAVIKKGTFLPFISEYQPDILCLQETKAKKNQVEIDLPDYFEIWNSAERAGYSGTAIFSKGDVSRLQLRHQKWDKAWLEYMKKLESIKPVLFCGDLNVAHTEDDLANPKPNIGKHGFTNEERAGFDAFIQSGFKDTFRIFTKGNGYYSWWTHWANARARNIGWRIDYWLVSEKLANKITEAQIHPDIMGSDHCPVSITIDI